MDKRIFSESERYFQIFEELSAIPHPSGSCREICNWCREFAEDLGLRTITDQAHNIIIFKEGTAGMEDRPPVIIQGHLDMVLETEDIPDAPKKDEPLRLRLDGDFLTAEHTTLGGDDGIAVAYALALLESKDIAHPPLEILLTSDEETGMNGAVALDPSPLSGRRMINVDSEEEGYLLCGCAGGVRIDSRLPVEAETVSGSLITLTLSGMTGGHSGCEIHRGRRNACIELGTVLSSLVGQGLPVSIIALSGGGKDNAIPRKATASFVTDPDMVETAVGAIDRLASKLKEACTDTDPEFCFEINVKKAASVKGVSHRDSARIATLVSAIPDGVLRRDPSLPAGIETSSNLGILSLSDDLTELRLGALVRSAVNRQKDVARNNFINLVSSFGGRSTTSGEYPAWEYRADSPLRDKMAEVYKELTGEPPKIEVIHAGLECGILADKLPGLDCVSVGPNMYDVHTTSERLSVSSCRRVWDYLVSLLAQL